MQTIQTSNQMARGEHSAHIYEGKMYVFGGVYDNRFAPQQDFWCLDLSIYSLSLILIPFVGTFTWEQVYFKNWREGNSKKEAQLFLLLFRSIFTHKILYSF